MNSSTSQNSEQQAKVICLCCSTSATEDLLKWNFLEEVEVEFESKFSDVNEHKEIFNFIESSFIVDVSSLTPAITQLCPDNRAALDDILHVELRADVGHFWSWVSEADFPTLKPLVQKVTSFFMSTSTCDQPFQP